MNWKALKLMTRDILLFLLVAILFGVAFMAVFVLLSLIHPIAGFAFVGAALVGSIIFLMHGIYQHYKQWG